MFAPNRIAVYLTALAGLAGGLAPVVGDLDITSTVGIVGGLAAILGVVRKWLDGWQAFEERSDIVSSDDLLGGVPLNPGEIAPDPQ